MNVRVILQSLHQVLWVVEEVAKSWGAPLPLSGSAGATEVLIVPLPVIRLLVLRLPSIGIQYVRLIGTIAN